MNPDYSADRRSMEKLTEKLSSTGLSHRRKRDNKKKEQDDSKEQEKHEAKHEEAEGDDISPDLLKNKIEKILQQLRSTDFYPKSGLNEAGFKVVVMYALSTQEFESECKTTKKLDGKDGYIDIWLKKSRVAIELKYNSIGYWLRDGNALNSNPQRSDIDTALCAFAGVDSRQQMFQKFGGQERLATTIDNARAQVLDYNSPDGRGSPRSRYVVIGVGNMCIVERAKAKDEVAVSASAQVSSNEAQRASRQLGTPKSKPKKK